MGDEDLYDLWLRLSEEEREEQFRQAKSLTKDLGLSESRIRSLVDEGSLPAIRIFGRIRIHYPSVVARLKEERTRERRRRRNAKDA